MEERDVFSEAKRLFKYLILVNLAFLLLTIFEAMFLSERPFPYFAIFYLIEALLFVVFFIPVFVFHIIKGKSFQYSVAVARFGDFYHAVTRW